MNEIHFAGYNGVHPEHFVFDVPSGYDCYLFLLTLSPARFWQKDKVAEFPAGTAILYPPDCRIHYGACKQLYQDDWLRFSSDDPLVTTFPLLTSPFPVSDLEYYHNLLQLLTWESSLSSENSPQIISYLIRTLFLRLYEDSSLQEHSMHGHELLTLHKDILTHPEFSWSIGGMASRLHLSPGHLQLLYKQKFGISCMDDVINSRIRKARELLASSAQPIREIAHECGYHSIEHFNRQFHSLTQTTPGAFRKEAVNRVKEKASSFPSPYRNVAGYSEDAPS